VRLAGVEDSVRSRESCEYRLGEAHVGCHPELGGLRKGAGSQISRAWEIARCVPGEQRVTESVGVHYAVSNISRAFAERVCGFEGLDGVLDALEHHQQHPAHGIGRLEDQAGDWCAQHLACIGRDERLEDLGSFAITEPYCGVARVAEGAGSVPVPRQCGEVVLSEFVELRVVLTAASASGDAYEVEHAALGPLLDGEYVEGAE
jgi:hypothetical protein